VFYSRLPANFQLRRLEGVETQRLQHFSSDLVQLGNSFGISGLPKMLYIFEHARKMLDKF